MYIVAGATGQTGSVVARILLEKGLPVRVIVRSGEKGKSWKDLGAEIAVADVRDAESLTEALKGGTVLYLMNPPDYGSEDMFEKTKKVIEAFQTAIENSEIEKLVVLSSVGAHRESGTGVVGSLHLLEEAFKDAEIPVTFIRPPSFMENWNSSLESVTSDGVLPSFYQPLDKKIPHIAAEDVGQAAAEAMLEKTGGVEVRELAGKPYSANDFAEAFSKVLGREIRAVPVPEEQWLEIFKTFCSPRNAELMAELTRGINNDALPFETDHQAEVKTTVEDYARKVLS